MRQLKTSLKIYLYLFALLISTCYLVGCEKLIDVKIPVNQLASGNIYLDSVTAQATVNGMYAIMYNTTSGQVSESVFGTFATTYPARSADELYLPSQPDDEFFNNNLLPVSGGVGELWNNCYQIIYQSNKIIEGMTASSLSPSLKRQLTGEARFMRAYCHFTLVNFFGPVPLITTSDVAVTRNIGRTPVMEVYSQIIEDLRAAQSDLATDYSWSLGLRTRVNRWSATALLARVYLYNSNWAAAEEESTKVISQGQYSLPRLSDVFLRASQETIWAFNTNQYGYTFIARALLPVTNLVNPGAAISPSLLNAFERDPARPDREDDRFSAWIRSAPSGMPYAAKYASNTAGANLEFAVVLRLGEQFLIRAEARAMQGNLSGCAADLNRIRTRAGLRDTPAQTREELLSAVAHERQVELFLEYGQRWFDLKRTGQADAVLSPIKGAGWRPTDVLYPIPEVQIINNANLYQNQGY